MVDLADAHLKALNALNKNDAGFTCNLGTGTGSSVLEVIAAFEKATGRKIPYEIVGRRTGDVTEAWADPSYAEKLLGWKTERGLEEMLADAWFGKVKIPMVTAPQRTAHSDWGLVHLGQWHLQVLLGQFYRLCGFPVSDSHLHLVRLRIAGNLNWKACRTNQKVFLDAIP